MFTQEYIFLNEKLRLWPNTINNCHNIKATKVFSRFVQLTVYKLDWIIFNNHKLLLRAYFQLT